MRCTSCIGLDENFVWYCHYSKNEIIIVPVKINSHGTYDTAIGFNVAFKHWFESCTTMQESDLLCPSTLFAMYFHQNKMFLDIHRSGL